MERPKRIPFTGHPQIDCDLMAKQEREYTTALEKYADHLEIKLARLNAAYDISEFQRKYHRDEAHALRRNDG
jgi:hypothetical protein